MKIRLTITAAILLNILHLSAQDIETSFFNDLKQKNAEVKTIVCDFVQTSSFSVLAKDVREKGIFTMQAPGNMLLSFEDGDYIKMTDKHFSMQNAGQKVETGIASNPMLKEMRKLLSACMTGNLSAVSTGFEVSISEDPSHYNVCLTPAKGRGVTKIRSIHLVFEKSDMSLATLSMQEASGDSVRYEFSNKKFNLPLKEDTFE